MAAYNQYVHDHQRDWTLEVGNLKKRIAKQSAIAAKNTADSEEYQQLVQEKQGLIEGLTESLRKATKLRGRERAAFEPEQAEYVESIDALERALKTLKSRDRKLERVPSQDAALIQSLAAKVPRVLTLLQQPQAKEYGYEFQGGQVVEMLKKLHEKFEGELRDLETGEANKKHAHNMLKQSHEDEMSNLSDAIRRLSQRIADAQAAAAEAQQNVLNDTASRDDLMANLAELIKTHQLKTEAFENNQKVREAELTALAKAVEILGGMAMGDVRQGGSFIQIASQVTQQQRVKKALNYLLNAKANPMIAFQMLSAAKGPLDKVTGMIRSMIAKLEKQHAAEQAHHEWCEKETKANKQQVEQFSAEVDGHIAAIGEMKSQLTQLLADQADAESQESELIKAMSDAEAIRVAEKQENEATIADAIQSKEAVGNALVVLREFYNKGAAFVQTKQAPEMKAYGGMSEASGGVVGMLEVIETDFARLESDTTASENESSRLHEEFMKTSEANKVVQHKRAHDLTMAADRKDFEIHQRTKELTLSQKELDETIETKAKLQAACVPVKVSYEERVAMRDEEIGNLEEALKILNGQ